MQFQCARCQSRYRIADDKVDGRVLKIRCKNCGALVVLRGPGAPPADTLTETPDAPAPQRTVSVTSLRIARPLEGVAAPIMSVWHVAIGREKRGPLTNPEVESLLNDGAIDGQTYVWRTGMTTWVRLNAVAELAALLEAATGGPRTILSTAPHFGADEQSPAAATPSATPPVSSAPTAVEPSVTHSPEAVTGPSTPAPDASQPSATPAPEVVAAPPAAAPEAVVAPHASAPEASGPSAPAAEEIATPQATAFEVSEPAPLPPPPAVAESERTAVAAALDVAEPAPLPPPAAVGAPVPAETAPATESPADSVPSDARAGAPEADEPDEPEPATTVDPVRVEAATAAAAEAGAPLWEPPVAQSQEIADAEPAPRTDDPSTAVTALSVSPEPTTQSEAEPSPAAAEPAVIEAPPRPFARTMELSAVDLSELEQPWASVEEALAALTQPSGGPQPPAVAEPPAETQPPALEEDADATIQAPSPVFAPDPVVPPPIPPQLRPESDPEEPPTFVAPVPPAVPEHAPLTRQAHERSAVDSSAPPSIVVPLASPGRGAPAPPAAPAPQLPATELSLGDDADAMAFFNRPSDTPVTDAELKSLPPPVEDIPPMFPSSQSPASRATPLIELEAKPPSAAEMQNLVQEFSLLIRLNKKKRTSTAVFAVGALLVFGGFGGGIWYLMKREAEREAARRATAGELVVQGPDERVVTHRIIEKPDAVGGDDRGRALTAHVEVPMEVPVPADVVEPVPDVVPEPKVRPKAVAPRAPDAADAGGPSAAPEEPPAPTKMDVIQKALASPDQVGKAEAVIAAPMLGPAAEKPAVSDAQVSDLIARNVKKFSACKSGADPIRVKVAFEVDPEGAVVRPVVDMPDGDGDTSLSACIRKLVQQWQFPKGGRVLKFTRTVLL